MIGKNENLNQQPLSDKELLQMVCQPTESAGKQAAFTKFIRRYERFLMSLCRRSTWYFRADYGPNIADELYSTVLMEIYEQPAYLLKGISRLKTESRIQLRIQTLLSQYAKMVFKRDYIVPRYDEKSFIQFWDPEVMDETFGEPDKDKLEPSPAKKEPLVLTKQDRIACVDRFNKLKKKDREFCDFLFTYLQKDKNLPPGIIDMGCEKFGMKSEAFKKRRARMVSRLRGSE